MNLDTQKEDFLLNQFVLLLRTLDPNQEPQWGKMNVQQMIEHMSDSIKIATQKDKHDKIITPEDKLESSYRFLKSDKPFRENTKNVLLSDNPPAARGNTLEDSIIELEKELGDFKQFFQEDPGKTTTNPFFGHLNYGDWVQLLHKHAQHHLKQFAAL